jgi:hypothetical protein
MPQTWLQVRVNGSKYESGMPPRRAFWGSGEQTFRLYDPAHLDSGICLGFAASGSRFRVSDCYHTLPRRAGIQAFDRVVGPGFRAQGSGIRDPGSGFRVSGTGSCSGKSGRNGRKSGSFQMPSAAGLLEGKVYIRLTGKGNPNSHGARPVY